MCVNYSWLNDLKNQLNKQTTKQTMDNLSVNDHRRFFSLYHMFWNYHNFVNSCEHIYETHIISHRSVTSSCSTAHAKFVRRPAAVNHGTEGLGT